MPVTIVGNNTPTAGGVVYGDGTNYVSTSAGTAGQVLLSNGSSAPSFGAVGVAGGGTGATSLTANNVLLGNGTSAIQTVAPGTNGNVLTSNGTTWTSAAAPGGGSWIFLTSANFPGNTSDIDITSPFSSTYDTYWILFQNVICTNFNFRVNYGSGFVSSNYEFMYTTGWYAGSTSTTLAASSGASRIPVSNQNRFLGLNLYIYNRNNTNGINKGLAWDGVATSNSGGTYWANGVGGQFSDSSVITGIRVTGDGNFTSGSYFVYGLKKTA